MDSEESEKKYKKEKKKKRKRKKKKTERRRKMLHAQHVESMCTFVNFRMHIQVFILNVLFLKYCFDQRQKEEPKYCTKHT
jgi:cytoskeletal protein RodZ